MHAFFGHFRLLLCWSTGKIYLQSNVLQQRKVISTTNTFHSWRTVRNVNSAHLRQQSIPSYCRLSAAFVEKALRACKKSWTYGDGRPSSRFLVFFKLFMVGFNMIVLVKGTFNSTVHWCVSQAHKALFRKNRPENFPKTSNNPHVSPTPKRAIRPFYVAHVIIPHTFSVPWRGNSSFFSPIFYDYKAEHRSAKSSVVF